MTSFRVESVSKRLKLSPESEENSNDIDDPDSSQENESLEKDSEVSEEKNDEPTELDIKVPVENINANFFSEELTSHDEIFTFQCPKNFSVSSLLNKELNLSDITKIKNEGNKFSCQVLTNHRKTLTCVLPSEKKGAELVKLPIVGHILVRQVLKMPHKNVDALPEEPDTKPLPQIRESVVRHPLLGTNWDRHMMEVRKRIKKHKKLLKRSLKHEKSLVEAEKERKKQKKKLKVELSLLQKKKY